MSRTLLESVRKIARGEKVESPKKAEELTEAYPGKGKEKQDAPLPQGSSQKPHVEPLYKGSGAGKGVKSAAPLAPKVREFQAEKPKQGSSQDAPIVDVDSAEVGKRVSAKMKKDTTLPKGNGAGKAPNFKTKGNPADHVGAKSNDGNVFQEPGNHGPKRRVAESEDVEGDEEVVEMTQEEFDALSPEEQDELVRIEEEEAEIEEEVEVLDEKQKADKSKKEKSDKEDEKTWEAKRKAHKEEVNLDVKKIFASETELSDEFKEKAAGLFEAAVSARVAIEVEEMTEKLADESVAVIEEHKAALTEQVDAYLTKVANEWLEENALAVEDSLRTDLTESFMEGMKKLFAEHYIEIPEDKYDVLSGLQEEIDALKAKIDEQDEESNALAEELLTMRKNAVIAVVSEGLAETEVEKFEKVIADVEYEDDESYTEKLNMIKENVFRKKGTKLVEGVITEVEEEAPIVDESGLSPRMQGYLRTMRAGAKSREK
jgi:hypothetical protein